VGAEREANRRVQWGRGSGGDGKLVVRLGMVGRSGWALRGMVKLSIYRLYVFCCGKCCSQMFSMH
jgi:hypothetical protein